MSDAFDAPNVTRNDVTLAPATSADLLNRAMHLFFAYGLDQADDVRAWLDEHASLTDGSLR